MATIAIGDIHGNLLALEDLLSKVLAEPGREDVLVFLGDYIDPVDSRAFEFSPPLAAWKLRLYG